MWSVCSELLTVWILEPNFCFWSGRERQAEACLFSVRQHWALPRPRCMCSHSKKACANKGFHGVCSHPLGFISGGVSGQRRTMKDTLLLLLRSVVVQICFWMQRHSSLWIKAGLADPDEVVSPKKISQTTSRKHQSESLCSLERRTENCWESHYHFALKRSLCDISCSASVQFILHTELFKTWISVLF